MPRLTRQAPRLPPPQADRPAVVTLDGRDHYLGPWTPPRAADEYDRLIAEWLAAGRRRRKPRRGPPRRRPDRQRGHAGLLAARRAALPRPRRAARRASWRTSRTPSGRSAGSTAAPRPEFGPLALRAVRDEMVRSGLARTTVNARVNRVRRVFRWAASVELVPASVVGTLRTVDGPAARGGPRPGRPDRVGPVPVEHVEAALPFLPGRSPRWSGSSS